MIKKLKWGRSPSPFKEEFNLGYQMNHPNLVKARRFYTKKYANEKENQYKLEMDKVEGISIKQKKASKVIGDRVIRDKEILLKLFNQVKDCGLYLFDQNIVWFDVHQDNLLITNDTQDLKIIDYGSWRKQTLNFELELF